LQDAPTKVAVYVLADDVVVVENFRDEAVTARLDLEGEWTERIHRLAVQPVQENRFEVTIPSRDIVALQHVGS
jgi:hypothetical protein